MHQMMDLVNDHLSNVHVCFKGLKRQPISQRGRCEKHRPGRQGSDEILVSPSRKVNVTQRTLLMLPVWQWPVGTVLNAPYRLTHWHINCTFSTISLSSVASDQTIYQQWWGGRYYSPLLSPVNAQPWVDIDLSSFQWKNYIIANIGLGCRSCMEMNAASDRNGNKKMPILPFFVTVSKN